MKKIILLSFFWLFTYEAVYPNNDTISNVFGDSIEATPSDKVISLLKKVDSIAFVDSINKVLLMRQLDDLRSYERTKRQKINKELEELKIADSLRKIETQQAISKLKNSSIGYPVIVHKDTLFHIYTRIGNISPYIRANLIKERLTKVYQEFYLKYDSLAIKDFGQWVDIYYKDRVILSITELDALWYNKEILNIAEDYKTIISRDILQYKNDRDIKVIAKEIGLAFIVIVAQILLIIGINYFFRAKINRFIWNKRGIWFNGIKIKNYEIIDANRETSAVLFFLKLIRITIIIVLLSLSLPLIFSIFPPTRHIAETLMEYIISPLRKIGISVVNYIPNFITIAIIFIVTRYILKFTKYIATEIEKESIKLPKFYPDWARPTYNIIKILTIAFMFVVIFPYLPGSDSAVFKGVSVFIGLLFSLGSSSMISNIMAGLVITYMRPFKVGDRIQIKETTGNVVEKTSFVTRIRTSKKEFITIPNSVILASNVINYSNSQLQGGLIVHTTVTIGYDVPWREVHRILVNAAKETSFLNLEIAPFVLQTSLDDFYVSYQLNAHTNEPDKQPLIYSELHQNIQDGFNEAGIEILSPHYRAQRDGNAKAIPKDNISKDSNPPGFKIKKDTK